MHDIFNLNRWLLLVRKQWVENRKNYLLAILAIGGLLIALDAFVLLAAQKQITTQVQSLTYYAGLGLGGCLFGSLVFADLSESSSGINFLMLPASLLEKLLCQLLFSFILFFIVYTIVFYLVDIPMVNLANKLAASEWKQHLYTMMDPAITHVASVLTNTDKEKAFPGEYANTSLLLSCFAIQSFFIMGSVYYSRYSFIKTTILILLIAFALFIFFEKLLSESVPSGVHYNSLSSWSFLKNHQWNYVTAPTVLEIVFNFAIHYVFPLVFFFITYQCLKEKEI